MNKYIKHLPLFLIVGLLFTGCESKLQSRVVFENYADGALHVNFRGQEIKVPARNINGPTKVYVDAIKNGVYSYSTTYEIPFDATSSSASGAVSGDITIKAGTKVLIIFSSTYDNGVYQLSATMSSSEDLSGGYSVPL